MTGYVRANCEVISVVAKLCDFLDIRGQDKLYKWNLIASQIHIVDMNIQETGMLYTLYNVFFKISNINSKF